MSTFTKTNALQIGNIIAFIATLAVNGLANTSILGGKSTGQISDLYPTLITPAGYVFAIWGIIYTLLAIFVVYQVLPSKREGVFQTQISFLFIFSSLFNIIWIFLWQYNYIVASVPLMLALLATLVAIYLRLRIGNSIVAAKEKVYVHLPFSVYLGWITVATAADIAAAVSSVGWVKWTVSDAIWGVVAALAVLVFSLLVIAKRNDFAYGFVIVWAFAGIAIKQSATPIIVYATEIGVIIIVVAMAASFLRFKMKKSKQ
jgi:benzodiazapine receptor